MKKNYHVFAILFLFLFCTGSANAQTSFTGKPRYQILATQNNATLGIINVELFPNIAPYHVRNFDSLVSTQFYDSTAFHRVVPGFVIQGGDPNTKNGPVSTWGYGQPWQPTVKAEFSAAKHERGILSAARSSNINSATSQFFICVAPASNLNGAYSVYGRVTSGMNIVDQIVNTPVVPTTQRPQNKISMFVTYIGSNDTVPQPAALTAPLNDSLNVDTNMVTLKWNKVSDGIIYHLDVSHDSLFSDTVKSIDLAQLNYNLLFLPAKTKYYWKIKVNNGGHFSNSQVWHFTTAPKEEVNTTALSKINASSNDLVIFPNPTKDKIIVANLETGDLVEVSDLSGRLIFKGLAKDKNLTIDLSEQAKGTYVYKVSGSARPTVEGKLILTN